MSEEKNELAEMPELEEKPTTTRSSKDLWLFLIVIDVICLCVFGFFLYKNLSAKLLAPQEPAPLAQLTEEAVIVETPVAETVEIVQEVTPVEPVVVPAEPEPVPSPSAEPIEPEPVTQVPAVTEKKESVSVKVNPKSKYRQVTFRYFDKAKSVAVVSGFTMAKPRALTKKDGIWETTLAISPGTYKYLLVVDGKQQLDPYAPEKDGRSLLVVE